jgi:hypothetical protein
LAGFLQRAGDGDMAREGVEHPGGLGALAGEEAGEAHGRHHGSAPNMTPDVLRRRMGAGA